MYYLNDKHPKYEYDIYIKNGEGIPYINGKIFTSYKDVCNYLDEIAKRHIRYNRVFYIDDDFFDNKYKKDIKGTYYKILKRPVADWEETKKGA